MKSDLHNELQYKACDYCRNKSYWISDVEVRTGFIVDVWGMSPSLDYVTIAIEVKVSKEDFRSRSQKDKNESPPANTNYILCPAGLIQPHEVHENWGLLWWNGRIQNKKQPKFIELTDRYKLMTLAQFLSNGVNTPRTFSPSLTLSN